MLVVFILAWIFVLGIIIAGLIIFFKSRKEKEDFNDFSWNRKKDKFDDFSWESERKRRRGFLTGKIGTVLILRIII